VHLHQPNIPKLLGIDQRAVIGDCSALDPAGGPLDEPYLSMGWLSAAAKPNLTISMKD
jgi:hypothetical protein